MAVRVQLLVAVVELSAAAPAHTCWRTALTTMALRAEPVQQKNENVMMTTVQRPSSLDTMLLPLP